MIENVARILFARFGTTARSWEQTPIADQDEFRHAAQAILTEFAAVAPVEAPSLVKKIRETRPTRLGFLYMAYALNEAEAAALLAFQTNKTRRRESLA